MDDIQRAEFEEADLIREINRLAGTPLVGPTIIDDLLSGRAIMIAADVRDSAELDQAIASVRRILGIDEGVLTAREQLETFTERWVPREEHPAVMSRDGNVIHAFFGGAR